MTRRVEDMLRDPSARPAAAASGDLHARIMSRIEGEPGGEPVGGRSRAGLAGGAIALAAMGVVAAALVLPLGGEPDVRPADSIAIDVPTERFSSMPAAMASPLEREAELLRSDARALIEGLRSRLPSM